MWWGTAVQPYLSPNGIKREDRVPWSLLSLCQLHVIQPQHVRSEEHVALSLFPVDQCGLGRGIVSCEARRAVCVCVWVTIFVVLHSGECERFPAVGDFQEGQRPLSFNRSVSGESCCRSFRSEHMPQQLFGPPGSAIVSPPPPSLSQVMSFPSVSRWVMWYRHCLSEVKAGTLRLRLWTGRWPCRWNSSRPTSIASSSWSLVPQTRRPYLQVRFISGLLIWKKKKEKKVAQNYIDCGVFRAATKAFKEEAFIHGLGLLERFLLSAGPPEPQRHPRLPVQPAAQLRVYGGCSAQANYGESLRVTVRSKAWTQVQPKPFFLLLFSWFLLK